MISWNIFLRVNIENTVNRVFSIMKEAMKNVGQKELRYGTGGGGGWGGGG